MSKKPLPFTKPLIEKIAKRYPTPFYIYDENGIIDTARSFNKAFSWARGFRNFFAVKACPNPHILKILKREGFGNDCSSLPELIMSERVGITGESIMFTSNDTPAKEFKKAAGLGAIINLDDITHIPYLEKHTGIPGIICFRFNPGSVVEGNDAIGQPEEAKFGLTREQIFKAYGTMRDKGVKRFGLHAMVASNILDPDFIVNTAKLLFGLASELSRELGIQFEFVNLGGGIGIPYRLDETPVDIEAVGKGVKHAYEEIIAANGMSAKVVMECGRAITGPHGYFVSKVLHMSRKYRNFAGLDGSTSQFRRPTLPGAYHHITVLGKEKLPATRTYDVTGSLCTNRDKFAVQRRLPEIEIGDIIVIHDAGAHGYAASNQYNGKLRCAELLLKKSGNVELIRRAETVDDYFATLASDLQRF